MNAQAPLSKPNNLKISCALAEVIGLAETNSKDFRDLFDGVGTLNIVAANLVRQGNTSYCSLETVIECNSASFPNCLAG